MRKFLLRVIFENYMPYIEILFLRIQLFHLLSNFDIFGLNVVYLLILVRTYQTWVECDITFQHQCKTIKKMRYYYFLSLYTLQYIPVHILQIASAQEICRNKQLLKYLFAIASLYILKSFSI